MSPTRVSKEQFGQLLERLESHFPHSLKIYGIVRSVQAGHIERDFIANRWPDFSVLVEKPIADQGPVYINNVYSVFTTSLGNDVTDLQELLMQPGVINWKQEKLVFGGCLPNAEVAVRETVQLKGNQIQAAAGDADMYWVASEQHLPDFDLPTGYTLSTLRSEEAATVTQQWEHSDQETETYTRFLLDHYSTMAVRDSESNALVGYYLQQWNYTLGMLYVDPGHRGKGLGKVLVVSAARQVLQNGDPAAFCFIEKDNPRSAQLHMNCGFKKVAGSDMKWLSIVPAGSASCGKAKCCV